MTRRTRNTLLALGVALTVAGLALLHVGLPLLVVGVGVLGFVMLAEAE